ncbi:MAG TPA: zf-HC2 domain-containing protein [Ktedonobacterales bacterium]|jgi:predicted anti-sigma-YlaC factor YlaD|nr:zf-HC2 domain-containing protein [Ktedonobacterales bacterium]
MLMAATDLTCQELVELVTAYLEGALPPEEYERFDAHLAYCVGCRNYLDQMRETIGLVGTLCDETVPSEATEHLLQAFRTWKQG